MAATDPGAGDEHVDRRLSEALGSPVTTAELCRVVGSRVGSCARH